MIRAFPGYVGVLRLMFVLRLAQHCPASNSVVRPVNSSTWSSTLAADVLDFVPERDQRLSDPLAVVTLDL